MKDKKYSHVSLPLARSYCIHDTHGLVEHTSSRILLFFLIPGLLLQRHTKGSLQ